MKATVHASTFVRMVHQKPDADGTLLPIWFWKLQHDNVTVAFGKRRSEQQARSAAEARNEIMERGCSGFVRRRHDRN